MGFSVQNKKQFLGISERWRIFPTKMILGRLFYVEKGKDNINRARRILMEEFGLVPPKGGLPTTEKSVVVWEDNEGIGRYRVHFYDDVKKDGVSYEGIQFKYWLNYRIKREILEEDPLSKAVDSVRKSIEGKFLEKEISKNLTIDQILQLKHL